MNFEKNFTYEVADVFFRPKVKYPLQGLLGGLIGAEEDSPEELKFILYSLFSFL